MKFLICNFTVRGGSTDISYFDDTIMKEAAFSSKSGLKGSVMYYTYCLVPYVLKQTEDNTTDYYIESYHIAEKSGCDDQDKIFSLYKFLKKKPNDRCLNDINFSIDIIREIDDTTLNILYTDGSFKKDNKNASYACFQLTEELNANNVCNNCAFDDFTQKTFCYNKYSGVIEEGTNNIGELTGIKTACENFGSAPFQLIISDSEYSIKAFREWIYNWKNNGFKTYANKPIANKDLIESTFNKLTSSDKIIFYKWTRGHDNNSFNELCDKEAKAVLGI